MSRQQQKHNNGLSRLVPIMLVLAFLLTTPLAACAAEKASPAKLTSEERAWLDNNREKLVLFYNVEFPPIEFSSADGSFIGMGADVIARIEEILDVAFIKIPSDDWNKHLAALESGECAIAPTIVRTTEREAYAFFTTPYATAPVVIITTTAHSERLTLDDLSEWRVGVVSGYATENYLRDQALLSHFEVVPVTNVPEGLQAVSFGQLDAFVENIAVAAYFIEQEAIPNLRVAGETAYAFDWSIGVSRQHPLLYSSIQAALDEISAGELGEIRKKWITLEGDFGLAAETVRLLIMAGVFIALLLLGLAGITLILKKRLAQKVADLRESEERFRSISELALDAIIMIDHEGKVVYWSPSAEKIFGYTSAEVMGRDVHNIIMPEKYRDTYEKGMKEYRLAGQGNAINRLLELTAIHKNGHEIPIEIAVSPIIIKGEYWASAIIRDISVRKEAEQKIADYTMELEHLYHQLDRELDKARLIHERTLPKTLPRIPNLSLAAHYQPARRMGSDFYNVTKVGNKLLLYLSDVAGHGLEGAMLSVFVKEAINSYISLNHRRMEPGEIISHLDRQYRLQNYPEDYFICIFLAVLDLEIMELTYAGAGFQNSPLVHLGNGEKLELGESDLPIMSVLPRHLLNFDEASITLTPGSTLLFTTDGLPEQIVNGQHYNNRLAKVFYKNSFLPPEGMVQLINEDFRQFNNGSLQGEDDITFVAMQLGSEEKMESRLELESSFGELDYLHYRISNMIDSFAEKETLINILHEMVANAIEHGNKFDPEKKVYVQLGREAGFVYAVVEDEGDGCNWREKIDNSFDYSGKDYRGRGIIISRMLCENLLYNEKGNKAFIIMKEEENQNHARS